MNEFKARMEQIYANHAEAVRDPESQDNLVEVLDDMTWILENFCSPGVMISALSIANHARQVERENIIAMLEFQRAKESAGDGKIRERLGEVAQGAVLGTLDALIQHLKELP